MKKDAGSVIRAVLVNVRDHLLTNNNLSGGSQAALFIPHPPPGYGRIDSHVYLGARANRIYRHTPE